MKSRLRTKVICEGWSLSKFNDLKISFILTVPLGANIKAIRNILSQFPGGSSKFIIIDIAEGTEIYFITDLTFNKCFERVIQDFNLNYVPQQTPPKPRGIKKRPILQYSLDGKFIKEWEAISYASKDLGINPGNIANVAKGVTKTAGGFLWRYKK